MLGFEVRGGDVGRDRMRRLTVGPVRQACVSVPAGEGPGLLLTTPDLGSAFERLHLIRVQELR
ncbi:hypothetical protein [Streptomyces sp. NPDC058307]|uniref:hypothetical protein n=1 Tax=Streptomyces sp. NPDC058307 TaxID=3346439 RepID=UPI0036E86599